MIIFELVSTPKGKYAFERNNNSILKVSEDDFKILSRLNENEDSAGKIVEETLSKYKNAGFFLENSVKKIEHPMTDTLEHHINHRSQQLVIQLTQNCNLRCSYCVYSGSYNNRGHKNVSMTAEMAFKGIDYLFKHSSELDEVTIAFYGGEPLLQFKLIQKCVQYAEEKKGNKKVVYTATTNGTLLTDKVVEFIIKNDFRLLISLDGPREEHNLYRTFKNGMGSFDIIMENVKRLLIKYPDFEQNISFNGVLNPDHDYDHVKEFFENDELMKKINLGVVEVDATNTDEIIEFNPDYNQARSFDYLMYLLVLLKKVERKYLTRFLYARISMINETYHRLKNSKLGKVTHHGGPCLPGVRRIFLNAEGKFYPCERVSETSDVALIGDINRGVDLSKAEKVLNIGRVTENECLSCWALPLCTMCIRDVDKDGKVSRDLKLKKCEEIRKNSSNLLKEIILLREFGYTFEGEDEVSENSSISF